MRLIAIVDYKARIDDVDVVVVEDEVWFLQDNRVCWVSRRDALTALSKVASALKERGYRIDRYNFPKKLREFILEVSRPGELPLERSDA